MYSDNVSDGSCYRGEANGARDKEYAYGTAHESQVVIMDKDHITIEGLLYDPGYSGEHTYNGSKVLLTSAIYSNRT